MKIVTIEEMRRLDARCASEMGIPTEVLMENAGHAVARKARQLLGSSNGAAVLVLVGPGNNGGDGLVAACYLQSWGASVTAYLALSRKRGDPNFKRANEAGVAVIDGDSDKDLSQFRRALSHAGLVIDAVLGTGHLRPLGEPLMEIFRLVTEERRDRDNLVLLALDIPTGMDADTGAVDPSTPHFDVTVTLAYPKVGLFKFPGAARVGQLEVVDIGIPPRLAGSVNTELLTPEWVTSRLPERPPDAHKGTFGRLLIIAGSHNYVGAAVLAAEAAYRVGAGLVTVATPQSVYPLVAISVTEATHLPLPESGPGRLSEESVATLENAVEQYDAAVIGCGMGQYPEAQAVLGALLFKKPQKSIPAIIDADGLNNLARLENWWSRIRWPAILTPHPGEMARLTGSSTRDVQGDRLATARDHAARWDKVVVLKGAYSVVASPDGTAMVSPFANPALASAGTGDVLAGVIGGLLAQGMSPFDASACGVYLHAKAGEEARCDLGDAGLLARDLPGKLPTIMGLLKARHPQR